MADFVTIALDGAAMAEAEHALAHIANGVERAGRNAVNAGLRAGRKQVVSEIPQYINYASERIEARVYALSYKQVFHSGQLRIYGGPLSLTNLKNEYVPVRQGLRVFPYTNGAAWFIPYSKLVFVGRKGLPPIITMRAADRKQIADWPTLVATVRQHGIAERALDTMGKVASEELGNQVGKLLAKNG
jgi:hypothetical protein